MFVQRQNPMMPPRFLGFFESYTFSPAPREVRFLLNAIPLQLPQKGIQIINYRIDVVRISPSHR